MGTTTRTDPLAGRTILLAGGTGAVGLATARAATARGARVVIAGRRSDGPADLPAGCEYVRADVTDGPAVDRLAEATGPVDGLFALVGGWRGGGGLAGQTEGDFRALEPMLTALRLLSRRFEDDLVASPAGRLAIISSTAVARPGAGVANYASLKAASEAWTLAVAAAFERAARTADAAAPQRAAAVVFRVGSLSGLEDAVADAFVGLWRTDAAAVNGAVRTIEPPAAPSAGRTAAD